MGKNRKPRKAFHKNTYLPGVGQERRNKKDPAKDDNDWVTFNPTEGSPYCGVDFVMLNEYHEPL